MTTSDLRRKEIPGAPAGSGAYALLVDRPRDVPEIFLFASMEAVDRFIVSWIEDEDNREGKSPVQLLAEESDFLGDYSACMNDNERVCLYLETLWDSSWCGELVEFRVDALEILE